MAAAALPVLTSFNRFVDSEIALDAAIGSLLLLTQNPALFFPELVRLNSISSLVDLLSRAR